jgi:hypothetical protein
MDAAWAVSPSLLDGKVIGRFELNPSTSMAGMSDNY